MTTYRLLSFSGKSGRVGTLIECVKMAFERFPTNTLLVALAVLWTPVFFSGCANVTPSSLHHPEMKISKTVLSNIVDPDNPAAAFNRAKTEFYTDDKTISSVVALENLHSNRTIRWEWICPENRVYYRTKDFPIAPRTNRYIRSGPL